MDNLEIFLKFADHGIQNLARLHNIRHLIYGLYFAMLATFISIFIAHSPDQTVNSSNLIQYLPLIAAIMGQALIILQLIISLQIHTNYDGLQEIFDSVPAIKIKNERIKTSSKKMTNRFLAFL
jgi:hypothetical protein